MTYPDFVTWQMGTGLDANSVQADPMLRSIAVGSEDLRLNKFSNDAIDFAIGSTVNVDYFGTVRPYGTERDIGAHEWTNAAPSVTVEVNRTGTPVEITSGGTFQVAVGETVAARGIRLTATDFDTDDLTVAQVVTNGGLINGLDTAEWEVLTPAPNILLQPSSGVFETAGTVTITLTISDGIDSVVFVINFEIVAGPGLALTTTFAAGNGASGNMFDIHVFQTRRVSISGIDIHTFTTLSTDVSLYYRAGTYVGFETNAAAWTLHETVSVTGQGTGVPTPVTFTNPLTLTNGASYGLYVHSTSGVEYTNGSATYIGAHFSLELGVGTDDPPFTFTFSPRIWNGTIHYTTLAPASGKKKKKGGGGDDGCSTGGNSGTGMLALLGALAALGVAVRLRRGRA